MFLVGLLDAPQNFNRFLDGWLIHEDWLEAASQGCVAFDMLTILVKSRRADALQFTTGQCRLKDIRSVHTAARRASANQHVNLVNKEDAV